MVDYLGYQNMGTTDVSQIFYDVPSYYEHANAISAAYTMGVMKGVGNGLFAPEDSSLTGHFLKVLVNVLGYEWKAELGGGYPAGYLTTAAELKLLDGVSVDMNAELTRTTMVNILYNALEAPVCVQNGVSDDSADFTTDEDVTILTYYHDIYNDTAIVNSNRAVSLDSSLKPKKRKSPPLKIEGQGC